MSAFDSDKTAFFEPETYCFEPNKKTWLFYLCFMVVQCCLVLILVALFFASKREGSLLSFMPFYCWVLAVLLVVNIPFIKFLPFLRKTQIHINEKGVSFSGFKFVGWMPDFMPWEKTRARWMSSFASPRHSRLLFYMIDTPPVFHDFAVRFGQRPFYIDKNTSLSLEEVIEKFQGKIETLSKEEQTYLLYSHNRIEIPENLGKRAGHVAYTSLILFAIASFIVILTDQRALGTLARDILLWGTTLIAGISSFSYLLKNEVKGMILYLCPLSMGAVFFLMFSLSFAVPSLLGQETTETFVLDREKEVWQGQNYPDIRLPFYDQPHDLPTGTAREATIYRGPFGLASMERNDLSSITK